MRPHRHVQIEIAFGPPTGTLLALAGHTDPGPCRDTGRDLDLQAPVIHLQRADRALECLLQRDLHRGLGICALAWAASPWAAPAEDPTEQVIEVYFGAVTAAEPAEPEAAL